MPDASVPLKELFENIERAKRAPFAPNVLANKLEIIDYAFTGCRYAPRSFADLGGVWGVNGAYTFYALDRYEPSNAWLIDTCLSEAVLKRAPQYPHLHTVKGNFGDFALVETQVQQVDAIIMFDVLLHQVQPDWNEVLAWYAQRTDMFVIYNQQFTATEKTVRLLDLGLDAYFANVPHSPAQSPYRELVEDMNQIHPGHNRPWRDVHHIWQWGITDNDLRKTMDTLGFTMQYYKNCGRFGSLPNFENHAYVFVRTMPR